MSEERLLNHLPPFSSHWALFLDVDGTLLEIADHPDRVVVDPRLRRILERLYGLNKGAVALISGRSIATLDRLFAPLRFPIAGQHGVERRDGMGKLRQNAHCPQLLAQAREKLSRFVAGNAGLVLEDKGLTLALHYRRVPRLVTTVTPFVNDLMQELGDDLQVQEGKMVFEIKPSGKDKGAAIAEFMREALFQSRVPVFIGDDTTDEYGFKMVNGLRGHSIKVGPGPSVACFRLTDVGAVRVWLARYVDWLDAENI